MKKIYVLDTNVLLTNWKSLYAYQNNDIVIPLKVLEEILLEKKVIYIKAYASKKVKEFYLSEIMNLN
jgi:predicted ribonuclease YlaK